MPEPRRTAETIPGARPGSGGSPCAALHRDYRHQAAAEEKHPRQIVAALRARIAARSPEHAALVADFEAAQQQGGSDDQFRAGRKPRPSGRGKAGTARRNGA